ncbi:MAG: hypothetical protein ACRC62_26955 [Microcoleus sp.]
MYHAILDFRLAIGYCMKLALAIWDISDFEQLAIDEICDLGKFAIDEICDLMRLLMTVNDDCK